MIASSPGRCRKNFRALTTALAAAILLLALAPRAEARRVGYANVASDGEAGRAAIGAARAYVTARAGGEELEAEGARAALEDPVEPGAAADGAALARARKLLGDARAALKAFEYDDALDRLRQADAALRGLLPSPEVTSELYEVNLLAGQVQAARGDEARALDAFLVARRLVPEHDALNPARYRPQVVQLYERAGALAGATGASSVQVVTEPPAATVWLDGRAVGQAPLELTGVAPGEHYVGASLDGHVPRSERISVRKDGRSEQAFLLARLPAEQRARALRAGLLGAGRVGPAWTRAAAALADVASVDVLVLVRDAEGGQGLEAAAWDARSARLGAWVSLADGGKALVATLPALDASTIAVPPPRDVAGRLGLAGDPLGGGPGREKTRPRWYRTWWGMSLLIGGGVLVTGALLMATAPDPASQPDSLVITNPHWQDGLTLGAPW